jgi:hypothetical protein
LQIKYFEYFLQIFQDIFNNQAGDMLNLSKVIGEDAILFGSDYDDEMIKLSFKKFCANKNVALEF